MVVHYDDLVSRPRDIVSDILTFLGDELVDDTFVSKIEIFKKFQHRSLPSGLSDEILNRVKCCKKRIDEITCRTP